MHRAGHRGEAEVLLLDEPDRGARIRILASTLRVEGNPAGAARENMYRGGHANLQQAARVSNVTGFMFMGELVEIGPSSEIFTSPKDRRTDDYITGRFG